MTHMGYCLRLECERSGVPLRKIQQNGQPIAGRVVVSRWLSALNFLILFNELNFATGCKPDAFRPTLCYIASINDHQEQAKFNNMGSATRHCRQGRRRRGVEGVRSPHFLKPRGRPPRNFGISVSFFLEAYKFKVAAIRSETKF